MEQTVNEKLAIEGFFRVQIVNPDGSVAGDSGWRKNRAPNPGIQDYLTLAILGNSGSKLVSHLALGTGTEPGTAATSLEGEVEVRKSVSTSSIASTTAQFTAQFASGDNFVTTTMTIKNIGLFSMSNKTTAGNQIFAGNTYATSTVATNQAVNATYQIRFATTT